MIPNFSSLEHLLEFPDVYFVAGDPSSDDALRSVALQDAHCCLLLMDRRTTKILDGEYVDNDILRRFLAVGKFVFDPYRMTDENFHYLVEIQSHSTLKIMNRYNERIRGLSLSDMGMGDSHYTFAARPETNRFPTSLYSPRRDSDALAMSRNSTKAEGPGASGPQESINFGVSNSYLLPFFASGLGFPTGLFDILPGQTYFNQGTLRFFDALVGHHINAELPDSRSFPAALHRGCALRRIHAPNDFFKAHKDNPTYESLFFHLLSTGHVPFALYRTDDMTLHHYVSLSPVPTTRIKTTDFVFVIAPHHGGGGKTPIEKLSPKNGGLSGWDMRAALNATQMGKMALDVVAESPASAPSGEPSQPPPSAPEPPAQEQEDTRPAEQAEAQGGDEANRSSDVTGEVEAIEELYTSAGRRILASWLGIQRSESFVGDGED